MKKLAAQSLGLLIVISLSLSSVMGNSKINKKHKGKKMGGQSVNCTYCHKKAGVAKKKGQNVAALKSKATCKTGGCH